MCLYNSFSTRVAGTQEYSSKQLFSQPEHYGRIVGVAEMSDCLKVVRSIICCLVGILSIKGRIIF